MAATTAQALVKDAHLQAVLSTAEQTRDSCFKLLELLTSIANESADTRAANPDVLSQRKILNAHLAKVRNKNREAVLSGRATKHATAEARSEVDTLHLQLQNLYYEQNHLNGEIAACEDYPHKYATLPLIPVDTFLDQFPEHADSDDNSLMIARIEHEHAERQALEEQRQQLLKKKQGLIAENKKRRDDLANLDKKLEAFMATTDPILEIFEKEY